MRPTTKLGALSNVIAYDMVWNWMQKVPKVNPKPQSHEIWLLFRISKNAMTEELLTNIYLGSNTIC